MYNILLHETSYLLRKKQYALANIHLGVAWNNYRYPQITQASLFWYILSTILGNTFDGCASQIVDVFWTLAQIKSLYNPYLQP